MIEDTTIIESFKKIQNNITTFLEKNKNPLTHEDLWDYHKGTGGGITRVWENTDWIEKGGVNFSHIKGDKLPNLAIADNENYKEKPFIATGVSVVIHPKNPFIPTIHMNIRYFRTDKIFWFGGGIDLTPTYPKKDQVIQFHQHLQNICQKHHQDYSQFKQQCDDYFFLPHRNEMRGVGGIFFDQLKNNPQNTFDFVQDLGLNFNQLYKPFLHKNLDNPFTPQQKEFQEHRRSRYVEFNLLYDRGTHFGLQSEGRTESILISMPKIARWNYKENYKDNSPEQKLIDFYLKPQNWVNL